MQLADVFESIRWGVVALSTKLVAGPSKPLFPPIFGTGFVVHPDGLVATNKHVAEALMKVPCHPLTGEPSVIGFLPLPPELSEPGALGLVAADVVGYYVPQKFSSGGPFYGQMLPDIGFVRLNLKHLKPVSLDCRPSMIRTGTEIATCGFSLGAEPLVVMGKVNQVTPFLRQGIVSSVYPGPCPHPHGFTIDAAVQGGASGSPVFLRDTAAVIGMVQGCVRGAPNATIAIPATLVHAALQCCLQEKLDLSNVPTIGEFVAAHPCREEMSFETFVAPKPPAASQGTVGAGQIGKSTA